MSFLREKSCLQHQTQAGLTVLILEFLFTDLPLKHTISCYSLPQRKAALMVCINLYFNMLDENSNSGWDGAVITYVSRGLCVIEF